LRSDIRFVDFSKADLSNADLSGCEARHALFKKAQLNNAKFLRSKAQSADFSDADLRNARFVQADLRGSKFTRAQLNGADFTDAILTGSFDFDADAAGVILCRTVMPDGGLVMSNCDIAIARALPEKVKNVIASREKQAHRVAAVQDRFSQEMKSADEQRTLTQDDRVSV